MIYGSSMKIGVRDIRCFGISRKLHEGRREIKENIELMEYAGD